MKGVAMYPLGESYGFDIERDSDSDEFRFICAIAQRKILHAPAQQAINDRLIEIAPMIMGSCDPSIPKNVVNSVLTDEAVRAEFGESRIYKSLLEQVGAKT